MYLSCFDELPRQMPPLECTICGRQGPDEEDLRTHMYSFNDCTPEQEESIQTLWNVKDVFADFTVCAHCLMGHDGIVERASPDRWLQNWVREHRAGGPVRISCQHPNYEDNIARVHRMRPVRWNLAWGGGVVHGHHVLREHPGSPKKQPATKRGVAVTVTPVAMEYLTSDDVERLVGEVTQLLEVVTLRPGQSYQSSHGVFGVLLMVAVDRTPQGYHVSIGQSCEFEVLPVGE